MSNQKNACCITLNKDFLPGFEATMNSILQNTKGFDEPIICINIDLSQGDKDACKGIYDNVTFVDPIWENYKQLPYC